MVYSISGISSRAFSSFCREKLEYPNIITTAAGGSTRPPWSSSRRCFPPGSCSCGRCFPWECSRSRGLSKGSPARSLSMRAHECGRGAECPPGQGVADLQRAVYMGGCLRHRPVRIRLQGSEPGTVCQRFLDIKNAASYKNDAAKTKISPVDIPTGRDPRTKPQRRVALADFSAAPWRGFEKSERGPNSSSLFQPLAAVVAVALG